MKVSACKGPRQKQREEEKNPTEMTFQICLWYSDINVISFHLTGVSIFLSLTLKQVTKHFFLVLKLLFVTAYVSRSLTPNFPCWSEYLVPNPHSSPTSISTSGPDHVTFSHPQRRIYSQPHMCTCASSHAHTQHAHTHVPQAPSILPPS